MYRICSTSDKISSIITTPATQPSFSFNKYSLVVWNERDKSLEFRRNITFTRTPSMNVWFFPVFASNSAHLAVVSKVTTYSKYSLPFPVLQLTKYLIPFAKFFLTFYNDWRRIIYCWDLVLFNIESRLFSCTFIHILPFLTSYFIYYFASYLTFYNFFLKFLLTFMFLLPFISPLYFTSYLFFTSYFTFFNL